MLLIATFFYQTESALLYDGVKLLATALQDLDQSQSVDVQSASCEFKKAWAQGSSLINYIRPVSFCYWFVLLINRV